MEYIWEKIEGDLKEILKIWQNENTDGK